ncbi:MAG: universal stress protein [Methanomassiliicoccales archaeon]|nr:MAG: universal stress protein [Methanomassiliicoccales archaeon]
MGEILVAYDGSEAAKKAVDHGINLLKPEDRLIILSIVPSATIAEFADIDPEISIAKAQESINELLAEMRSRNINAIGVVREGDIADEILKMGSELKCDLIVVGHKGIGKIGRFQLGSVADKVARYANRPVLIVR